MGTKIWNCLGWENPPRSLSSPQMPQILHITPQIWSVSVGNETEFCFFVSCGGVSRKSRMSQGVWCPLFQRAVGFPEQEEGWRKRELQTVQEKGMGIFQRELWSRSSCGNKCKSSLFSRNVWAVLWTIRIVWSGLCRCELLADP